MKYPPVALMLTRNPFDQTVLLSARVTDTRKIIDVILLGHQEYPISRGGSVYLIESLRDRYLNTLWWILEHATETPRHLDPPRITETQLEQTHAYLNS